MSDPRIAIVGATGVVGGTTLDVLRERAFPVGGLRLAASARSVGKTLAFAGEEIVVEETAPAIFDGCDIAFISATDAVSREMGLAAKARGCVVVDDSGVWRMEPDVPLVVPEINGDDVDGHRGILSIPNCAATPIVLALDALRRASPIRRVIAATYQSVSGAGAAAMAELDEQSRAILAGHAAQAEGGRPQIAFNLLPRIGSFHDNGYTSEETKIMQETRKILHEPDLSLSATCARVPVPVCHSAAVNVEFERPVSAGEARSLLAAHPGVAVVDDPEADAYPTPADCAGRDDVFVGRIREDSALPNGIALWIVADNLRKGAATNAVQIAEEVVRRNAWLRAPV